MADTFFSRQGERANGFFGPPAPPKKEKDDVSKLQEREEEARRLLEASGEIPEPQPAPLERAIDVLMRPTYAGAGAVEELVQGAREHDIVTTQDIRDAVGRAGREFFSGIGGLQGDKQSFGGVLEDLGVEEHGRFSSLAPFLYNQTGKGWKFKQGGPWDPTGRGAMGFALDTPLDPLTYVSLGTAPGATSLIRVGGRIAEKQAFSRAGLKAIGKVFEAELPDATKLSGRILRGMRQKAAGEVAEDIVSLPPLLRNSPSRVRLEGEFNLAKKELENVTTRLQKKPLDPFLMAEHQRATAKLGGIDARLNRRAVVEEAVHSRDLRSGLTGVADDEALHWAREQQILANEIAHQNSISRVHKMILDGSTQYADNSVIRFAGRPLLNKEHFKPIGTATSRMLRHVGELPYGAQIMANVRKIEVGTRKGRQAVSSGIDRMFNETLRAARNIPGALEARMLFRAESRNFRKATLESVAKMTKGLEKVKLKEPVTFAGRKIDNAAEYVSLHLDDPVRFPKEALPPEVVDRLPVIRAFTAEMFRNEARAGIIDPKTFREHYVTHIFDNTDDEITKLSTSWTSKNGVPFDKTFMRGPWGESRVFPTFTDAVEFAQKLKAEGVINFDLKPVLGVGELLAKRADSHSMAIASERYYTRVLQNFGLSPDQVNEEVFRRVFPEIAEKLRNRIQTGASETFGEGAALDAIFPNGRVDGLTVGEMLRAAERGEPLPKARRRPAYDPGATPSLGETIRRDVPTYPTERTPALGHGATPSMQPGEVPARQAAFDPYGQPLPRSGGEPYIAPKASPIEGFQPDIPLSPQGAGSFASGGGSPYPTPRPVPGYPAPSPRNVVGRGAGKGLEHSPAIKALYWMGRVTSANSMEDLLKLMKKGEKEIANLDPKIMEEIRGLMGTSRRQYLAEFNAPYVRVKGGPYDGMYMPQAMAEEASRIGTSILNKREVQGFLKTWDLLQDIFKTNVTAPFPAFHIRNAMSNIATTFTDLGLSAFNPARLDRVGRIMMGLEGTVVSESGRRYTNQEVGRLFELYGMGTPDTALADVSGRRLGKQQNILLNHPAARVGRKVGQKIEDHAKLLNFVTWLERGLDPAEAAMRVHKTLFDYDQLSPVERNIMRRIFPFYTWTRKNLELVTRQLVSHPGRVKAQLAISDQDRGPEREMLPNYLRGDFKIKVKGDGKLTYLTGLDLPITSAVETALGTSGRNAIQQNLASVTPALKVIMELGFKRDLWTGRSLEERQRLGEFAGGVIEKLPSRTQEWLEYQKGEINGEPVYSMNGLKAYLLFKSYFLSRMFSSTVKLDSDNFKSWLVDFFTNVDLREFDLTKQQELVLRNRVREMESELTRRGVLVQGRPFLPKTSPYYEAPEPRKKRKKGSAFFD